MNFYRKTHEVIVIAFLAIFAFCGFSQIYVTGDGMKKCIEGNGKRDLESRKTDKFTEIHVEGAFDLDVVGGRSAGLLTVTAESNLLPHVLTYVKDGTLFISAKNPICAKTPINIEIDADTIEAIFLGGASDISLASIRNQNLRIIMEGSGTVSVVGNTKSLTADLQGSSDLQAVDLLAEFVEIKAGGASSAHIYADRKLNAVSSGASEIIYSGSPEMIFKDESGASEIVPFAE